MQTSTDRDEDGDTSGQEGNTRGVQFYVDILYGQTQKSLDQPMHLFEDQDKYVVNKSEH